MAWRGRCGGRSRRACGAVGRFTNGGGRVGSADARRPAVHTGIARSRQRPGRRADEPVGVADRRRRNVQRRVAELANGPTPVVDVALALKPHTGRFDRAAVLDPTVGGDDDLARPGADGALAVHAQAILGADEEDLAGVHAAEQGNIEREAGLGAGARGGPDLRVVDRHLVGTGHHLELVGPDAGVDLDRAREDGRVVGAAQIEAGTVDRDVAPAHEEVVEVARGIELRRAGGEGGAAGVDEGAAIDSNARGVGDDDFGALAGDFECTADLARVAAGDLVEDDARRAVGEPGVGLDRTTELGLRPVAAVVEDGPARLDVELLVEVARDASGAGGLDVDDRDVVGGDNDRGAQGRRSAGGGDDLGVGC